MKLDYSILGYEKEITTEDVLEYLNQGLEITILDDPRICMMNGGNTTIIKDDNIFLMRSQGQNWWDRDWEERNEEYITNRLNELNDETIFIDDIC